MPARTHTHFESLFAAMRGYIRSVLVYVEHIDAHGQPWHEAAKPLDEARKVFHKARVQCSAFLNTDIANYIVDIAQNATTLRQAYRRRAAAPDAEMRAHQQHEIDRLVTWFRAQEITEATEHSSRVS